MEIKFIDVFPGDNVDLGIPEPVKFVKFTELLFLQVA